MDITTTKVFDGTTIAASGNLTSDPINLQGMGNQGIFSLYIYETGDGTGKWTYLLSPDGASFVEFTDAADLIVEAFVKTSGPGGDGKDIVSFNPEVAPILKIKALETGGANTIAPVAYLIVK